MRRRVTEQVRRCYPSGAPGRLDRFKQSSRHPLWSQGRADVWFSPLVLRSSAELSISPIHLRSRKARTAQVWPCGSRASPGPSGTTSGRGRHHQPGAAGDDKQKKVAGEAVPSTRPARAIDLAHDGPTSRACWDAGAGKKPLYKLGIERHMQLQLDKDKDSCASDPRCRHDPDQPLISELLAGEGVEDVRLTADTLTRCSILYIK